MNKLFPIFAFYLFNIGMAFSQDLKQGLVAYYPFNGSANDESGNKNHGIVNGAALTTGRDGSANSAFYFDGVNDYISIGKPLGTSMPNAMTYCIWIKIPSQSNKLDRATIITQRQCKSNPTTADWVTLAVGTPKTYDLNGKPMACIDDGYYINEVKGQQNVATNEWTFLSCTKEGNRYKIYVNGTLSNEKSDSHALGGSLDDMTLMYHGGWNWYSSGSIDDVMIYNRALTDAEVLSLYKNSIKNSAHFTSTVNISIPSSDIDVFDPISKIDLFGFEYCGDVEVLSSPDEKYLLVQQSNNKFEIYETEKWKPIGNFSISNKKSISLAFSYFANDRIYLLIKETEGEKYLSVSIFGGEVEDTKCKKAPRGCLGGNQVKNNSYHDNLDNYFELNGFRLSFKKSNSCFINISKKNPEKIAFSSAINGSIDDCIKFTSKYPNSEYKEKIETAMLAKAQNLDGLGDLCKKYSEICTKAEQIAFDLIKNASKADKQKFLSIFPNGANFQAAKAQIDKIEQEEKTKLEAEKRKQEEDRIKKEEEEKRKELEEQRRIEEQKAEQARLDRKEQERRQKIQTNSNSSLWSLGSKVCNDLNGGIVIGVINQWNENKSSALIKILSAPSGSKYEGEKLYEDATIWIATSGKGWHSCLDDEFTTANTQKTDAKVGTGSSNGSSDNTEGSGKRGSAAVASKFAKLFMRNAYNDCNDDSDKQGFYSRILSWETVDWQVQEGYCYAVRVEFGWNYGAMKVREYKGVIHFEESGCGSGFMVEEKKELGSAIITEYSLRSLCAPIDKEIRERVNQHFKGDFKWSMGSGDCIEE